jgi:hypothetical protein
MTVLGSSSLSHLLKKALRYSNTPRVAELLWPFDPLTNENAYDSLYRGKDKRKHPFTK